MELLVQFDVEIYVFIKGKPVFQKIQTLEKLVKVSEENLK